MATQGYSNPDLLVETDWLEAHLDDSNIRIVDCDPYESYMRAHIKNAVGIRVHHYIKHADYATDPTGHPLVAPPDTYADVLQGMGISDDTLVVAYDSAGSLYATRFWWVLNYYGHTNVVVLNGGWRKWFDEARPATLERPRPAEGNITPRENPDLVCSLDYGIDRVGKADTVFLDVRSDAEWDGTNNRGNKRAGHVPGSVHLEWLNFVTDDTYRTIKPAHELRALLEERGVTADKQVITY